MTNPVSPNPEAAFLAHQAEVYTWAYRILRNHHDALDVTHEVFLRWWPQRNAQHAPNNLIGWLRRVTVNAAIDARRTNTRSAAKIRLLAEQSPARDKHASNGSAEQAAGRKDDTEQVVEALSGLTDMQRAVLIAKTCDGCTFARIAEQMDLAVPTVKTHYLRALRSLRSRLETTDQPAPYPNETNPHESPPNRRIGVPK